MRSRWQLAGGSAPRRRQSSLERRHERLRGQPSRREVDAHRLLELAPEQRPVERWRGERRERGKRQPGDGPSGFEGPLHPAGPLRPVEIVALVERPFSEILEQREPPLRVRGEAPRHAHADALEQLGREPETALRVRQLRRIVRHHVGGTALRVDPEIAARGDVARERLDPAPGEPGAGEESLELAPELELGRIRHAADEPIAPCRLTAISRGSDNRPEIVAEKDLDARARMEAKKRNLLRDVERALLDALAESSEVHRTLWRLQREG